MTKLEKLQEELEFRVNLTYIHVPGLGPHSLGSEKRCLACAVDEAERQYAIKLLELLSEDD